MIDVGRFANMENSLQAKIQEATAQTPHPLSSEEVTALTHEVIASLTGDMTAADLKFYAELQDLAAYILHAKQEIADIKPKEISASHIPQATDELDAVVGATEEATNKIMDQCDVISNIAGQCPEELGQQLVDCTTHIFEACNFQDITGQRITKVVQTLKYIDGKIAALMQALGEELGKEELLHMKEAEEEDAEKALLNGPQLPHAAIDQDAIDKMMGDMGG